MCAAVVVLAPFNDLLAAFVAGFSAPVKVVFVLFGDCCFEDTAEDDDEEDEEE